MWVDILISVIFIASIVQGYRKGFVDTCIHTVGWLLAVVMGFVWKSKAAAFLMEKTDIYDTIYNGVLNRLGGFQSAEWNLTEGLPTILKNAIDSATNTLSESLAVGLADMLFNIIAFLAVVCAFKLAFWVISLLISKKRNDGILGWVDGILGLLIGVVRGGILVYLALALMVPIIGISQGDFIREGLESSTLAFSLYNNNPIFLILEDIF